MIGTDSDFFISPKIPILLKTETSEQHSAVQRFFSA